MIVLMVAAILVGTRSGLFYHALIVFECRLVLRLRLQHKVRRQVKKNNSRMLASNFQFSSLFSTELSKSVDAFANNVSSNRIQLDQVAFSADCFQTPKV